MSGSKAEKSRNDTWGEKELAKYIGKESKKRTTDLYGSPKVPPKEKVMKQPSTTSSHKPRESSRDRTSSKQPSKSSPATSRKPEQRDHARASKEGAGHGRLRDTSKQTSSRDGAKKDEVKPSASSRGDLGGRSRQGGGKNAVSRSHEPDVRSQGVTKTSSSERKVKPSGGERHGGKEREREKDRERERERRREKEKEREKKSHAREDQPLKEHSKEKLSKSGASKLQSTSGSSIKSSHSREPGGPLSDVLLEREKQRRTSDKKHSPEKHKGGRSKEQHGGNIVVREDPPGPSDSQEGEVEEEEGMVVERVESGKASYRDSAAAGILEVQPMVEVTEELVDEEYQYEEEFEDYEEDFEEELESSSESPEEEEEEEDGKRGVSNVTREVKGREKMDLMEIMQAIDAENQMVGPAVTGSGHVGNSQEQQQAQQADPAPSAPPVERHHPGRSFVDFSTAQQREVSQRVAQKTRKRGQELLTMIDLDITVYDMFDLPPLSEYEVYIKNFGSDNTQQVLVQTGEDNSERDVQTDEVTCSDRWVQWPPEDLKGFGGADGEAEEGAVEWGGASLSGQESVRLVSFLKTASQVCSVLLEENLTHHGQVPSQLSQSRFPFCSSCLRIQTQLSFLEGRSPTSVQYCPSQPNLLLTAHSSPPPPPPHSKADETGLRTKGVLSVWNTREPSQPLQLLTCESTPTCCCFSPQKASLVFAGNEDGSVVLWDLREPLTMHKPPPGSPLTSLDVVPRVPTFSTASIPSLDSHQAPLVSITPLSVEVGGTAPSLLSHNETSGEDGMGLSFQLATLDRTGRLTVWVVVEIYHPDAHGSDSDLGLVPGGKVKLVKSASVDVSTSTARSPSVAGQVQVHCLHFHPTDTNHLYIGTDAVKSSFPETQAFVACVQGSVYHHTRYGKRPIPRFYQPISESNACVCDVVSMSFSPWQPNHFLVGCSDGTVQLYNTKRANPLVCWPHSTGGVAVTNVQWAVHQPGVFLVQDCWSNIYLWDLLQSDAEPVFQEHFTTSIEYFTFSPFQENSSPAILLAFADGVIEIHHLNTPSEPNRDTPLLSYFDNLV